MQNRAENNRLYEQVVHQIQTQILRGELRIGDQLPSERELARQFGVSRTAIREAVKTLREKGLVEVRLGRGTFVINNTLGAARRSFDLAVKIGQVGGWSDLIEVRQILEPEIAALAALRAMPEQVVAMAQTMETLTDAAGDVDAWAEADSDFHIILAEASANTIMPLLLDSVIELLHNQRRQLLLLTGRNNITQIEHQRILDAVARGDPDAAREAMRAHLERVWKDSKLVANKTGQAEDR